MSYYPGLAGGAAHFTSEVTNVDCEKQVRLWRLLRSVSELLLPACNCVNSYYKDDCEPAPSARSSRTHHHHPTTISSSSSTTIVMGTIYGYRHGKVKFCIQMHPSSTSNPSSITKAPIFLLLELAVPTSLLAREMRGGVLRIALECRPNTTTYHHNYYYNNNEPTDHSYSLLSVPVWTMYCNGRRVGFAVRRQPGKVDLEVLRRMGAVVAGAGVIAGKEFAGSDDQKDVMYLRGNFERVCGSSDAESFHLIDPDGCIDQELSIFFLRSP